MNRFLILEINEGCAALLTADGEFRTVPAQPGWVAGMELDAACLELAEEKPESKAETVRGRSRIVVMRRVRRWTVAIAACLLLLIGVQQGFQRQMQAWKLRLIRLCALSLTAWGAWWGLSA